MKRLFGESTRLVQACWLAVLIFAVYLGIEMVLAGSLATEKDLVSSLIMIAMLVLPASGLAGLASLTRSWVRTLIACLMLVTTAAGMALAYYVLHAAPPDGQNAIVVVMIAFAQMVLLVLLALLALILHLSRRS